MVSTFVPWQGPQEWMKGLRVLFRDVVSPQHPLLQGPRVRMLKVDMGPAAIQASRERQVEDESLPLEERMQALLNLAILDYAHGRPMEAIAKYKLLLGHYQQSGNTPMQALVMHGIGDVFQRAGAHEQAQHWYECAILPAAQSKAPFVLAIVVRSLGDLAFVRKRYAEAEQYFHQLDRLASSLGDAESKARALEYRGLSQERQGDLIRAIRSWEDAATLCRSIHMPLCLRPCLEHLRRAYQKLNLKDRVKAIESELAQVAAA